MSNNIKVAGNWREVSDIKYKVNGEWENVLSGYVKVSGEWKQFYKYFPSGPKWIGLSYYFGYGTDINNLTVDTRPQGFPSTIVAKTPNKYIGIDGSTIYHSVTGQSWSAVSTTPLSYPGIIYGGGTLVIYGGYYDLGDTHFSTDDGVTWSIVESTNANAPTSMAYGNGKFVGVGSYFAYTPATLDYVYSSTGTNWTKGQLPALPASPSSTWASMHFANNMFFAFTTTPSGLGVTQYATSTDGVSWVTRSFPFGAFWTSIAYGNGIYVAIPSQGSSYATSNNGSNWNVRSFNAAYSPMSRSSITFADGVFVINSFGGQITSALEYSADGVNWSLYYPPQDASFNSLFYG